MVLNGKSLEDGWFVYKQHSRLCATALSLTIVVLRDLLLTTDLDEIMMLVLGLAVSRRGDVY